MWVGFVEEFVLLGRVNRRFTSVVLTTGGIDDLCLKYFMEAGPQQVGGARRRTSRGSLRQPRGEVM